MEIDLNAPGAFALLCRCGKPQVQCATHEAAVAPDRVLLPAGVEPVHYDVALTLRLDDHAFAGTPPIAERLGATVSCQVPRSATDGHRSTQWGRGGPKIYPQAEPCR